jgi:hypothetical protein
MLPIQSARVGMELCSSPCSGESGARGAMFEAAAAAAAAILPVGITGAGDGVAMGKTRPGGGAATVLVLRPTGAESIFPNPIRTGAVSERDVICPPRRFRTSSRARTASTLSR